MSYSKIITLTTTAESPANALDTMPVITDVATPEQIAAYHAAYPTTWNVIRTSNSIITTLTYESKEVATASILDSVSTAIWEARNKWINDNHIIETIEEK